MTLSLLPILGAFVYLFSHPAILWYLGIALTAPFSIDPGSLLTIVPELHMQVTQRYHPLHSFCTSLMQLAGYGDMLWADICPTVRSGNKSIAALSTHTNIQA